MKITVLRKPVKMPESIEEMIQYLIDINDKTGLNLSQASEARGEGCMYRGGEEKKHACFIGMFMPDEMAEEADKLGNGGIENVCEQLEEVKEHFKNFNINDLIELQSIHDEGAHIPNREERINFYGERLKEKLVRVQARR